MSIDRITYRLATPDDQAFLDDMNVVASFWSKPEAEVPTAEDVFIVYPHVAAFSEGFGRDGDLGLIASNKAGESVAAIWARDHVRTSDDGVLQSHPFEITMAVRESVRGQGIGRQLLDSFATMAWLKGRNEVTLGVDERNPARNLYESVGFQAFHNPDGTEVRLDDRDAVMIRPLGFLDVDVQGYDSELSIVNISLRGMNHRRLNRVSTTTYQVTDGQGVMNIDGVEHRLATGDAITVPPNTPYFDYGNLDMVAVSIPPFDRGDVDELPFVQ